MNPDVQAALAAMAAAGADPLTSKLAADAGTSIVSPALPSLLDVLTLTQAAEYLQLSEDAVRAEAEAGRLVGQNVGGQWRFVRESIVTWLRTPRRPRPPLNLAIPEETPEEHEAFLASIRAFRDEVDRATGSGKYAPE